MSVACSFCNQPLIQAYQHLHYEYTACLNCYKTIIENHKHNHYQRLSLLTSKGNQKITKTKKINHQLKEFLHIKKVTLTHPYLIQAIDQFFNQQNIFTKSRFSDTSTSPSQEIQQQQINKSKPKHFQSFFQTNISENINIQKIIKIKDKITSTGNHLIEKIKQNQKIQKQVENINACKQRLIETGTVLKNKFFKLKSQVKDMGSQLPSMKQTIRGVGLMGVAKLGFFKKW